MNNYHSIRHSFNCCDCLFKILIWAGLFCVPAFAQAKHIIGGEMTYLYLGDTGPNKKLYQFTLTVFRDCSPGGGTLDNPAYIGVYKGFATGAVFLQKLNIQADIIARVDPVIPPCADQNTLPNICVERGDYTFTIEFDVSTDSSYFVVYQRCCRTDQIINVANPDQRGATYMVELTPTAMGVNNSSPTFNNYPPGFICNFFDVEFDHSATDAEGDSLVYEFCAPLNGGGQGGGGNCNAVIPNPPCGPPFTPLTHIGIYSVADPMGGNPKIQLNRTSGILKGIPTNLGQYVVAVCVREYRAGKLLGIVQRDFQFNVVDCVPSVVADILEDEIIGPKTFLVKSCGKKNIGFINQSTQVAALVNQVWEFDLGNGNLFTSGSFNVTVPFPEYGFYTGRLYLNRNLQCADTAFIQVNVFPNIQADFSFEYDVCTENPVSFFDSSVVEDPKGLASRVWDFGLPGATSNLANPTYQYTNYGQYPVSLALTDLNGCKSSVTKELDWQPKLLPEIPPLGQQLVCLPALFELDLFDPAVVASTKFIWDFGDGSPAFTGANPKHQYTKEGLYTYSVAISNNFGCFDTDTFRFVRASNGPTPDFEYTPREISNLNNVVQFTNKSDPTGVFWLWEFGTLDGSREQNPVFVFPDTGQWVVKLAVSNIYGCADSLQKVLDVIPQAKLYIPNVFNPNSTNSLGNEIFKVLGVLPNYSNFLMQVYSRWGELLFESRDPEMGWNGKRIGSNKPMPSGTYLYQVKLNGPRGEPLQYEGTVTIVD